MANAGKESNQATLASFWSTDCSFVQLPLSLEPVPKQRPSLQWTEDGPRGLLVCKSSAWSPPVDEPIRIASFDLVLIRGGIGVLD